MCRTRYRSRARISYTIKVRTRANLSEISDVLNCDPTASKVSLPWDSTFRNCLMSARSLPPRQLRGGRHETSSFSASLRSWRLSRSEEHTSELQSLMRISYAVFCLKKKTDKKKNYTTL